MTPDLLLQKLVEIERSIGIETDSTLRRKVLEAQECVRRMQGDREHSRAGDQMSRFALLRAFAERTTPGE